MITPSLAPWLNIADGRRAAEFYSTAFGARETYRLEAPDGSLILRFSVGGAEFWVSGEPPADPSSGEPPANPAAPGEPASPAAADPFRPEPPLGAGTIRMILTVPDPDAFFSRALAAGATEVFPVDEAHGWRLGRLIDPFGLHWEIGHPLD
jgi:PhnB protein